jgi:hypothetical protein
MQDTLSQITGSQVNENGTVQMMIKRVEDTTINIQQLTPYTLVLTRFIMGENAICRILRSGEQTRIRILRSGANQD